MANRTLTIRGVSDATLERLRSRAAASRRSLNGELLTILDLAAAGESSRTSSGPGPDLTVREAAAPAYADAAEREPNLLANVDAAALTAVCARHHIVWLAVFGSHARGDARPDSDVDVVVDFAPGATPGFGIMRVAEALRPVLGGRRVDLVTRRGLAPRLRESILSDARTLYAAE
jgi:predicted nucleotidyltransferase/plasmid stability protein